MKHARRSSAPNRALVVRLSAYLPACLPTYLPACLRDQGESPDPLAPRLSETIESLIYGGLSLEYLSSTSLHPVAVQTEMALKTRPTPLTRSQSSVLP